MTESKAPETSLDQKIKKSLGYSILDGTFYSAMVGFGESFFSAFAVFLKASNTQLGLLESVPKTFGAVSQLISNKLTTLFGSRKRFVCAGALLQGLMYILVALTYFFGEMRVFHLIVFVSVYWALGSIVNPAWSSWMGDLVDPQHRGWYFGKRNKIAGLTSFAAFLAAGFLLQRFSGSVQYFGFLAIFALALVTRMLSFLFLTKQYEPPYHFDQRAQFSFLDFVKQARFRNYGLFALYLGWMNFAVYIAAPFFTVYMLSTLQFDYLTFTLVSATSLLVKNLCMPLWGKASDTFGTRKVLSLTGFLMPLSPILWLFSGDVRYLVLCQVFSGFMWAGFELASFNFIFDTTSAERRATCVAYYNVLTGIAILAGAMLGSLIVKYNQVFWSKYLLVFLLSGLARYLASFLFLPKLREVRPVEHIPYTTLLFKVAAVAPTQGIAHQIITFHKGMVTIPKTILDFEKTIVKKEFQRIEETILPKRYRFTPKKRG